MKKCALVAGYLSLRSNNRKSKAALSYGQCPLCRKEQPYPVRSPHTQASPQIPFRNSTTAPVTLHLEKTFRLRIDCLIDEFVDRQCSNKLSFSQGFSANNQSSNPTGRTRRASLPSPRSELLAFQTDGCRPPSGRLQSSSPTRSTVRPLRLIDLIPFRSAHAP